MKFSNVLSDLLLIYIDVKTFVPSIVKNWSYENVGIIFIVIFYFY